MPFGLPVCNRMTLPPVHDSLTRSRTAGRSAEATAIQHAADSLCFLCLSTGEIREYPRGGASWG